MRPTCEDFDRLSDPRATLSPEEDQLWRRHLEGCDRCRSQLAADRVLRSWLEPAPAVRFSAGFDAALRRRFAVRRERRRLGWRARAFLAAYGTAATVLSVWILSSIAWPAALSPGGFGVVLIVAALAAPFVLLHPASPLAPPGWG